MAVGNKLSNRVNYRIRRSRGSVFLRDDFSDLGGYDQVGRALRELVQSGVLIKLGYGLYTRAKNSSLSGKSIPVKTLPELVPEVMNKLGAEVMPSRAELEYNSGESTQVPTGRSVAVKGRVSRKIGYDGKFIDYERPSRIAAY